MKYLLLVYGEEDKMAQVDDLSCLAFDKSIRDSGHCVASEALQPVATATTVRVRNGKVTVTDGPFAETKELAAGFWLWKVRSKEEATEWLKRAPFVDTEVEIRQVFETEEFAQSDPTGELRAHEERLRAQLEEAPRKST